VPRVSCPFCNASFDAPAAGRVDCPRCGDPLPGRGSGPAVAPATAAPIVPARRSFIPTIAVILLLVGLIVYLLPLLQKTRTDRPKPVSADDVTPPAELRGLAHLPVASNLVFAVQFAPLRDHAALKLPLPATLDESVLPRDHIDHLAGGVFLPDSDLGEFKLTVALVLRRPVPDEAKFLAALKAKRQGKDTHYTAELGKLPVKLAKSSDTLWLFGWSDADLAPAGGLSDRMRGTLRETFDPDTAAWLLTDTADWSSKPTVGLLLSLGGAAEWKAGLARVRAVAVGVRLAAKPILNLMVKPATPAARDQLRDAFRTQPGTVRETGDWLHHASVTDRGDLFDALRSVFAPR
jgi:hypothetical protein